MSAQTAHKRDFSYNPMATLGFSFIEFSSPEPERLKQLFHQLGFHCIGQHVSRPLYWIEQGNIRFLLSGEEHGFSYDFQTVHGPCACAMAFRVADAAKAMDYASHHGAIPCRKRMLELQLPAIYGIGDSLLYLVDKVGEHAIYGNYFFPEDGDRCEAAGLNEIDHLTHNVYRGHMNKWATYYEYIFNFHEIRYFDIKGLKTGLVSRAMTSPCGNIRIPINESTDDDSQIEEYLREYHGEGIQHIALHTDDIYQTVEKLRANGIRFMDVPDSYYELLEQRLPDCGEDIERLQRNKILVDGTQEDGENKLLLQIFTETVIGPIFFEIIQRKGDDGFGEGNFQALFDSIERDQIRRGVIKAD